MADSNSLTLLPPRPTAQPPQPTLSSQTPRSSGDDSFGRKLEKAKTHHAQAAAKKPVAEAPVKPAVSKGTVVKAATRTVTKTASEAEEDAATPTAKKPLTAAKTVKVPAEEQADEQTEQQAKSTDEKNLPELADHAVAAEASAAKKAVKGPKNLAGKAVPAKPGVSSPNQSVQPVQQKSAVDSTDDHAGDHTGVSAIDGSDDEDASPEAEFGTGKLAARSGLDQGAATGAAAGANAAAAAAAQAPVSPGADDAASADVATAIDGVVSKIAGKSASLSVTDSIQGEELATPAAQVAPAGVGGKAVAVAVTPAAQFVEENHPKIVSSIQGQLMPHGGTMQLRLDPPDLGALQVTVHLRDGVMTASFETSNDDATKLLSHSLGQLKAGLEAAGVSVDKIHVQQSTRQDASSDSDSDSKQPPHQQQQQAQQDQQRREMVQRMWRKLAGGGDPLDLVA